MSYFIRNGNTFRVQSTESLDIQEKLPVSNYTVKKDRNENFFLEIVEPFNPVKKLYGDTIKNAKRIVNTFNDRESSTGVMLNGEKGSGKTLLAKTVSILAAEQGVPTVLINQPWVGDDFNKFIQDIDTPCVILFDEFEKVYDQEDQEQALTLLDGVFQSKKLFIITCNDKWKVNEHMRNRPGRIYYMLEFGGLEKEFIVDYCEENLKETQYIEKICQIATLFDKFNFDMLKALVEEMNRYGESPQDAIKMLNAKPEFNSRAEYSYQIFDKKLVPVENNGSKTIWVNPLTENFTVDYDIDPKDSDSDWVTLNFKPDDIKKVDSNTGKFIFVNTKGQELVLEKKKQSNFDYYAF